MMHGRYGFMGFGLGSFLGIIILIVLIYLTIKSFTDRSAFRSKNLGRSEDFKESNSAIDILKERYAKGEIDEEEYKRMLKNLQDQ